MYEKQTLFIQSYWLDSSLNSIEVEIKLYAERR
jgi:hypothetical protein